MAVEAHDNKEVELRDLKELVASQDRKIHELNSQLYQTVERLKVAQDVAGFLSGCRLYGVTLLAHSELGITALYKDLESYFAQDTVELIRKNIVGLEHLRFSNDDREKIRLEIQRCREGRF